MSLSLPLSLFIAAVVGRLLAPIVLVVFFVLAAVCTVVLLFPQLWRDRHCVLYRLREAWPVLIALLGLAGYVVFITCSIQVGSRLYESVNYTDWSVRLPLVNSAIRNGVPPGNPFFTIGSQPQAAHFYYYWYVLCAQVGRPLHLSARGCSVCKRGLGGFRASSCSIPCAKALTPP